MLSSRCCCCDVLLDGHYSKSFVRSFGSRGRVAAGLWVVIPVALSIRLGFEMYHDPVTHFKKMQVFMLRALPGTRRFEAMSPRSFVDCYAQEMQKLFTTKDLLEVMGGAVQKGHGKCLFESLLAAYDVRGRLRQFVFFVFFMAL